MSFKDIKGQDKAIQILNQYIRKSCVGNAYLFVGPDDIGKTAVAKTLAKAVNCLEEGLDSCDRCVSCRKIDKGQHPDMHIIDNASDSIKIEHIRQLQKEINLRPYEGRKKVFIIDNAHNLTAEAANAVLKTLEEPAGNSLIMLITSKPALLFKTIISRCKVIKFVPLQRARLEEILNKDYALKKDTAHFLAYFCEGRLGYALRLKETDILNEKNRIIDEVISAKKPDLSNLSAQNRESVRYYLNLLASWFRDIYLTKIGMPYSEIIHLDRKIELTRMINRYAFFDLYEIINSISEAVSFLEQNVNIKLLMSKLSEDISYGASH